MPSYDETAEETARTPLRVKGDSHSRRRKTRTFMALYRGRGRARRAGDETGDNRGHDGFRRTTYPATNAHVRTKSAQREGRRRRVRLEPQLVTSGASSERFIGTSGVDVGNESGAALRIESGCGRAPSVGM